MAIIPVLNDFYIGKGVDSVTGETFSVAFDYDEPQPASDNAGYKTVLWFESVSSSSELSERLSITAKASLALPKWGASAEFNLVKSQSINAYHTYALVYAWVVKSALTLREPKLRPDAERLLKQDGWAAFEKVYGPEFLEGRVDGGTFYGVLEIHTVSQSQKQQVQAALGGYYGPFSASAELKTALQHAVRDIRTNIRVERSGSRDPVPTELSAMLDTAVRWPQIIEASPVATAYIAQPYRNFINLQGVPQYNDVPRQKQRDTLGDLGAAYADLRTRKANLEFILSRNRLTDFDEFTDADAATLAAKRSEYQAALTSTAKEIDKVGARAQRCAADYQQCDTYVSDLPHLDLPTLRGEAMSMKLLEDQVAALKEEVDKLTRGARPVRHVHVKAMPQGESDPSSSMVWIESSKQEPPYVSLAHHRYGGAPARYGYLHAGDFGDKKEFSIVADNGAQIGLHGATKVFVHSPATHVNGELHVAGALQLPHGGTVNAAGRMHIAGEELLYLLNKAGVVVSKSWQGNGDLTVEGNLKVDGNVGTHGYSAAPRHPNWGGGIHTWDVEAEGSIWSAGKVYGKEFRSHGGDLAENYASNDTLEPAEVVCLDPQADRVTRSAGPETNLVLGVVSTAPGVLLNDPGDDRVRREYPIALCGRVPCRVVNENGPIRKGDLLSTSSTPGHAMRAKPVYADGAEYYRPGTILGKALGALNGGAGTIDVFVFLG